MRILLVEDDPTTSKSIELMLQNANLNVYATDLGEEGVDLAKLYDYDLILLDLNLPDVTGIEGVMALRGLVDDVPLTVLSSEFDPGLVTAALAVGVRGYILKNLARNRLVDAFEAMWSGQIVTPDAYEPGMHGNEDEIAALTRDFSTLTPQQMNILRLICEGRPNKLISYELSIAEATVKTHIAAIMSKINVRNRTQAALLASKARVFTR